MGDASDTKGKGEGHRPGIDEYFMEIARVVSKRATCSRLKVGAVLVRDKIIVSTGYNGAPKGMAHCTDVGCKIYKDHCVRTVHAEQNAVAQAAYHGISTKDTTLYITTFPCQACFKILINAGIRRVVYSEPYEHAASSHEEANDITREFIRESALAVEKYRPEHQARIAL